MARFERQRNGRGQSEPTFNKPTNPSQIRGNPVNARKELIKSSTVVVDKVRYQKIGLVPGRDIAVAMNRGYPQISLAFLPIRLVLPPTQSARSICERMDKINYDNVYIQIGYMP